MLTNGFRPPELADQKFEKHVVNPATATMARWRYPTLEVFVARADKLLGDPDPPSHVHHCVVTGNTGNRARRNGRIIRYNERTEEFGTLSEDGYIITFFVPVPRTKANPFAANLEYFRNSCSH